MEKFSFTEVVKIFLLLLNHQIISNIESIKCQEISGYTKVGIRHKFKNSTELEKSSLSIHRRQSQFKMIPLVYTQNHINNKCLTLNNHQQIRKIFFIPKGITIGTSEEISNDSRSINEITLTA